jgi:hypothetical protein
MFFKESGYPPAVLFPVNEIGAAMVRSLLDPELFRLSGALEETARVIGGYDRVIRSMNDEQRARADPMHGVQGLQGCEPVTERETGKNI